MKQKRPIPNAVKYTVSIALAFAWAFVDIQGIPFLNMLTLVAVLLIITYFYEMSWKEKLVNIVGFIGIGILVEPVGLVILNALNYSGEPEEIYKYYFVILICEFIRGNLVYWVCHTLTKKKVRWSRIPRQIWGVWIFVFVFAITNCCLVILLALESQSKKSIIMCITIIISIFLTYYFMIYMVERVNYLTAKRHEDELYLEEMRYKEIYYQEVEKRNDEVQNIKHNIKNRLIEFHHLLEQKDIEALTEKLKIYAKEIEQIDSNSYCNNPTVDSVLRIKIGKAKAEGIAVETDIMIPKQMQLDHGDIGVLYGNLFDNAIEACRKLPPENRFIRVKNKFVQGMLVLIVENSKEKAVNSELATTKEDSFKHGRGINSIRKVVEKYNGTINFTDNGETFEASAMLYGMKIMK